eukprot:scaffold6992_cov102-Cylindrotheca_fusiformis.AAC.8
MDTLLDLSDLMMDVLLDLEEVADELSALDPEDSEVTSRKMTKRAIRASTILRLKLTSFRVVLVFEV